MAKKMKLSEQIAFQYLQSMGYSDIIYEPDGNIPPDFLVDKHIAVEVRRLNQNTVSNKGKIKGLEVTHIPFMQRMENYLHNFSAAINGESWFVHFTISQPFEPWGSIELLLKDYLVRFMHNPMKTSTSYVITNHLKISFHKAGKIYPTFFRFGGYIDHDAGGFVVSEIYRNLKLIIAEKSQKIVPYKNKYPEWWLVLTDYIGYGLDDEDKRQFRELALIEHCWNKIILLNPLNPENAFEI